MSDILQFLTGGVFQTFKELILNVLSYIVRFGNNSIIFFLSPLLALINSSIPNIDDLPGKLLYVLNYASPYINFILDLSFLSTPILVYLVASIIFRVTIRYSTYLQKILLQWYEKIIP